MNILENLKLGLEGLRLNKMRTFLTMLGIIIGIGSVIGILTVGKSIEDSFVEVFDQMGSNQINLYVGPAAGYEFDDLYADGAPPVLTLDQLNEAMEVFDDKVNAYTVEAYADAMLNHDKETYNVSVVPSLEGYKDVNRLEILTGRFISREDLDSFRSTVVVGQKLVDEIFQSDPNEALGSELLLDEYGTVNGYTIVGIVKDPELDFGALSAMNNYEEPMTVYIPWTTHALSNFNYNMEVSSIMLTPKEGIDSVILAEEISNHIKTTYFGSSDAVEIHSYTMEEAMEQFNKEFRGVQFGIGGIAAISLLVGGIGVMNILLVSVTERTREIGIRKALGATRTDIKVQFLIEAIIVCIIGGIIGILLGGGLGYTISGAMGNPTTPALTYILVAVGFSMLIGIFFGSYPAGKAAKLDPIDALRYE